MTSRQLMGGQFFMPSTERVFDDKTGIKLSDTESNLSSVAISLRKLLQMNGQTSEEKFKILDARDKLYKMMRDKDPVLKRDALVATCTDMCPEKERLLRDYQGRGSIFEMTNFSKNSTFNHNLAVKEYARSSADQEEPLPHNLRPIHVLTMTMSHLLHNVVDYCELSDENLEEWYMFLWDRTRALRKELTQQGVCSQESVALVEQCARFHIHCAERLIDQDSSIYDDKINTENLTKCLQTLKYMYKDLAQEDIKCPNESEFICYSLLLNLNNSSVFTELSDMSSFLMNSEPVKFALDIMTTWETKNYIRFFNLVKKTTYLNCCLLRRYFGEMRLYAIKTMIRSYCTKNYSPQILISRFVEMLNFEREEECMTFLSYCHFNFHKVDGKTVVNFDRILFQNPSSAISSGRAYWFIEEKKRRPLSDIIAGGTMPPRLFENYVPYSSFTPGGDLNPNALPQKELIDFFSSASGSSKIDSNKTEGALLNIFSEREQTEPPQDPKLQKEEIPWFSPSPMFSFKDKNPPPTNIFGAVQTSSFSPIVSNVNVFGNKFASSNIFGTFGNLPDRPLGTSSAKPIFGNMSTAFGVEQKSFLVPTSFGGKQQERTQMETYSIFSTAITSSNNSNNNNINNNNNSNYLTTSFQNKSDSNLLEIKLQEEKELKEKLEEERKHREKEEDMRKKKEEEEKARMLLQKRLEEENQRKEIERREKEKREQEERRKKEELARLQEEEAIRQERLREANEKRLKELKRQEENKRRIEFDYKQAVDVKLLHLKGKIQKWKIKIMFDKWRTKTWESIEEKKMRKYFEEVKVKYPLICTEKELNGNPYGLIIPSALAIEKLRGWKKEFIQEPSKKLLIVNDDLPLLKVSCILGKPLESLAKRLGSKLNPFPWKLIMSVPDNLESPDSWKSIETFVEMHFVEHFQWQFGVQKGPLYCRGGNFGPFRFNISIRRLRGSQLYEGSEPNKFATTGSNALIFFVYECGNEITRERLAAVLKSRSPLPKIPVVIVVLNAKQNLEDFKNILELEALEALYISKYFVIPILDGKHQLIVQLIKCLGLAASYSASPSPIRIQKFSNFFSGSWIDSLWRRVEISLSNFKIALQEPKVLIEFYNSCIEKLADIFLDKSYNKYTVLAEEFSECETNFPVVRTPVYENRLKSLLERLKLPYWPIKTPNSCHQLNYRIHQYCKKITGQNKAKLKNLKWILYRIIRQSLSWKGLDIYCEEDINEILANFPWIQVLKEISSGITRQLCIEVKNDEEVMIIYDLERAEKFSFESSFISKILGKSKYWQSLEEEKGKDIIESTPCLEKDSVVHAYSAAIERENNKRKREEYIEEGLDALFSSPAGKRIILEEEKPKNFDYSEINANFQKLDSRLDDMMKRMMENFKMLTDIQSVIK